MCAPSNTYKMGLVVSLTPEPKLHKDSIHYQPLLSCVSGFASLRCRNALIAQPHTLLGNTRLAQKTDRNSLRCLKT